MGAGPWGQDHGGRTMGVEPQNMVKRQRPRVGGRCGDHQGETRSMWSCCIVAARHPALVDVVFTPSPASQEALHGPCQTPGVLLISGHHASPHRHRGVVPGTWNGLHSRRGRGGGLKVMRTTKGAVATLLGIVLVSMGCVSLPPVVHVEHKSDQKELIRRLDHIEQRLDRVAPRPDDELRHELRRLQMELEELRRDLGRQASTQAD
jgi:hypothetical protein